MKNVSSRCGLAVVSQEIALPIQHPFSRTLRSSVECGVPTHTVPGLIELESPMFQVTVLGTESNPTLLPCNVAVLIGRDASCHIRLQDASASRVHCRIIEHDGHVRLYDAGSRWGTFVNGERISERDLQIGDRILIGATLLQLSRTMDTGKKHSPAASNTGRYFPP